MGEKYKEGHHALLNTGEENEMDIFGYKTNTFRKVLCIFGYIFTLGFLMLFFYWKPEWHVWAHCVPSSLEEADVVLLRTTDEFKEHNWKKVMWLQLTESEFNSYSAVTLDTKSVIDKAILRPQLKVRYIQVQKIRYLWDNCAKQFTKAGVLDDRNTCAAVHAKYGSGFSKEEQDVRRLICGQNIIDVGIVPIWKLLFKEVLNPFYVFQLFSVCLWFAEEYIEYSVAIILMSLICIILSVYTLRQQSIKLHRLVESHNNILVSVYGKHKGVIEEESRHLAPGDIIVIKRNTILPCDALLINGGCIVNESMLTGESIPVTKTPLPKSDDTEPWKVHSVNDYKRHILFCGTEVIQSRASDQNLVKAVVMRTGFNTAKGDLVRSILYPKPVNYKLYRDALIFLCSLIGLSLIGMIYAVCVFAIDGQEAGEVVKKALDVITIAVPPALPAALTAGIIYAQKRLENAGIFCISPQRINLCGTLNLFCFDKTGTLTEDGLDLWGLVPSNGYRFQDVIMFLADTSLPWGPLLGAMASCHSLIVLDGKIQGDPLDLKMFEFTCWDIEDSQEDNNEESAQSVIMKPGPNANQVPVEGIAVLQQFPFSSALQRMSVITQILNGDERAVYMKGAPEMVASFCKADTVPLNFAEELELYTKQGFRVIGLAYKILERNIQLGSLKRDDVESNLTFLGLLVLENRLKLETRPVLNELTSSRIRTVMITGDNLQTAVTVAKNSGMIREGSNVIIVDAMEPSESNPATITWTLVQGKNPKNYDIMVLINGTIFARMSPGHKSSLVEEFQKLGYYVGMCGDGANDCGALKMAHVGISLSEQEASVASPFTSKTPNIECVPQLIKEGRAALITSFCVFKYMALYSMIQYIGVLLLYWQKNTYSNYEFLFQDLGITTIISVTMSLNHAYPKLAPYRPPAQLISPPLLLSVVLNIILSLAMQICGFLIVQHQSWYGSRNFNSGCYLDNTSSINETEPLEDTSGEFRSYENTTVWLMGTLNCLIVALVFSKGKPFRRPIYTNYIFVIVILVQTAVCLFMLFADIQNLYIAMELVCTPLIWRGSIVIMLLIVLVISYILEEAIIENRRLWNMLKRLFKYRSKSPYKKLQYLLAKDSDWPALNRKDHADSVTLDMISQKGVYINPAFESNEES
ncbi:probable cation-transporting ATPase 13A4 isoform X2 [Bombina bombina]|uniref:probable cation-transporting ATPase 13A4 isoform X2 n=1 Tax=Bombina bombina TaxID=8345 RepID=UPI00235AF8DD|nr:probable cation-transporting ATPase 13A4 isoform X2 [Bombina bombina]